MNEPPPTYRGNGPVGRAVHGPVADVVVALVAHKRVRVGRGLWEQQQ